jgi:hypothetical protein
LDNSDSDVDEESSANKQPTVVGKLSLALRNAVSILYFLYKSFLFQVAPLFNITSKNKWRDGL